MCGLENDERERVDLHGISQACERGFDQGLGRTLGDDALKGGNHSNATLYSILMVDNAGSGVYVAGGHRVCMASAAVFSLCRPCWSWRAC